MRIVYLFSAVFFISFCFYGLMHEEVHKGIYQDYGIKSKLAIQFPNLVNVAESPCPTESCVLANEINEVVGYHAMLYFIIIGLGLVFIIGLLEDNLA